MAAAVPAEPGPASSPVDYRTHDVPVRGGQLHVGSWRTPGPVRRVVLATHGITSSHRAWSLVAERLEPGTLLLAPDHRGRGRSGGLPAPYGMATHAEDCARVLDELAEGRCDVVAGHSMGGFIAVGLAGAHPERVGALLLVDGGVPLLLPRGMEPATAVQVGLGPAAERLDRTFETREAYRDHWRGHPAFASDWSDAVAAYVDYDLDPDGPPWHSSCSAEAMRTDFTDQLEGGPVDRIWQHLQTPVHFVRAPRGLQDEPRGLYPPGRLADFWRAHPAASTDEVAGVNHYTITLSARGADAIADHLHRLTTAPTR